MTQLLRAWKLLPQTTTKAYRDEFNREVLA